MKKQSAKFFEAWSARDNDQQELALRLMEAQRQRLDGPMNPFVHGDVTGPLYSALHNPPGFRTAVRARRCTRLRQRLAPRPRPLRRRIAPLAA